MVDINLPPKPSEAGAGDPPAPTATPPSEPPAPSDAPQDTPPAPVAPEGGDTTPTPPTTEPATTPKEPATPKEPSDSVLYKRTKDAEKKAKEAADEAARYREKYGELPPEGEPATTPKTEATPPKETSALDTVRTVTALKDFSSDELEQLEIHARGLGIADVVEASRSKSFQSWLKGHRAVVASERATPEPSTASRVVVDKTQKEIGEMTPQELKAFEAEVNSKKTYDSQGV